ncbi:MAG TPA: CBS domain-containing protein [Vicinamibacterales bacterium]|nr:CBS domain-containing protein [Vicinamibacterales bacterium]
MRIHEIMSEPVVTVVPDGSAEEAWQLMLTHGVRHLVVIDSGRVVGVLSDSDAGGRLGGAVRLGATVGELMNRHVMTIARDDSVRKAANLMRGRVIGCLPVVESGRLVGVVTTTDMLKVLGGGVDRPQQPARHAVNHKVPHRKATAATGRW